MLESTINPAEVLRAGCDILDEVLLPYDFNRSEITCGNGSGGHFAMCFYECRERRLELSFRWTLGVVIYHLDGLFVSHKDYMLTILEGNGGNSYPGFTGDDPLEHFRQVAHDLKHFGNDFLNGDGRLLRQTALEGTPKRKTNLP